MAGNLANIQAQVITSATGGVAAGAAINAALAAEDAQRAIDRHRHQHENPAPDGGDVHRASRGSYHRGEKRQRQARPGPGRPRWPTSRSCSARPPTAWRLALLRDAQPHDA